METETNARGAVADTIIGFDSNGLSAFLLANNGGVAQYDGDPLAPERLATYRLFLHCTPSTGMREERPSRRRQAYFDAQVKDAADQFEAARVLLEQSAFSGVLLPLMNCAAVAIELYLKCLAAEEIHAADGQMPEISLVTVTPLLKGHALVPLFDRIADDDRTQLEQSFSAKHPQAAGTFREMLAKCEGAFAASRYPFEPGTDVSQYPLGVLLRCSAFLSQYVGSLAPELRIGWK